MTEPELNTRLQTITPPDEAARAAAHAHWAALAKPLGGLGSLETMLEDAAALTGTPELDFARRAVLVLCADNGVVAQGVSQTDAPACARWQLPPIAALCRWIWALPVPRCPACRTAALPPAPKILPAARP